MASIYERTKHDKLQDKLAAFSIFRFFYVSMTRFQSDLLDINFNYSAIDLRRLQSTTASSYARTSLANGSRLSSFMAAPILICRHITQVFKACTAKRHLSPI